MTLTLNQSNGIIEEVNTSIINKLYNVCIYNDNHNQNDYLLNGRLHSLLGYKNQADYLTNKFKNRLYITIDSYYVWFEDTEVRNVCINNFSSDGIGVTLENVRSVKYTSQQASSPFRGNALIEHFDEFNVFENITMLPYYYFYGCTNLKTINLENITYIGTAGGMQDSYTFQYCSSLQKIYAPNLTYVGVYTFGDCTSLKYIVLPSLTTIGRGDARWIEHCNSLEYILIGKIQETGAGDRWHNGLFNGLSSLKVVDLGDDLQTITGVPFYNCENIKAIIIRNTAYIPTTSEYPDSISGFNARFGNANVKIFVSDNLLNTYKSSTYWVEARNNIYPISTFKLSDYIDFEIPEVEDLYNSLYVEP